MFRKMRRARQQISAEECLDVLKTERRGVLSVIGDDGYPYGIPLNHWYSEKDNRLYFHGAKSGHKIDAIAHCDKVSYCVYDAGYRREGEWALNVRCVVVFGRMRIVEDEEKKREICTGICRRFTDDEEYLAMEFRRSFSSVNCLELIPEHMTGKLVNES